MSDGKARILLAAVMVTAAVAMAAWWLRLDRVGGQPAGGEALGSAALLGGEAGGFEQALAPRPFEFPRDHGAHPAYRHEWWYFTGNLKTVSGRPLGYQFTLFRFALTPEAPQRASDWAPQSIYMGHLAVTDIEGQRFRTEQRLSRGTLDLAGTSMEPFSVWLEDWRIRGTPGGFWPLRLQARAADFAIDLTVTPEKPIVLQGDRGLSQKGSEPGNASYYYSYPRLATRGRLTLAGEQLSVAGRSWLDREWGSSALGDDVVGWDWFALRLADGRDVMFYHLRRLDGTGDPLSAGVVVDSAGNARSLSADEVALAVLSRWTSPESGVTYPTAWRITIPAHQLVLEVRARLNAQEWTEPIRYWEGAVQVDGTAAGEGYLEMTGYGDR